MYMCVYAKLSFIFPGMVQMLCGEWIEAPNWLLLWFWVLLLS